jgi:hypothetical protein
MAGMSEWSGTYRLFLIVALGQIACCATVAVMGVIGGIQYRPGVNDVSNIGSALIFAAILFGCLGVGLLSMVVSFSRGSGMGRIGVFLAELLFTLFSILFFAPIAILFGIVSVLASVLLALSRRRSYY